MFHDDDDKGNDDGNDYDEDGDDDDEKCEDLVVAIDVLLPQVSIGGGC